MSWANRTNDVTQWHVALTPRGCIGVAGEAPRLTRLRLRSRYRRSVGWVVGHLVKPWLVPLLSRVRGHDGPSPLPASRAI
jgi:hypothetical protein